MKRREAVSKRRRWPRIVTLCGSTRFKEAFEEAQLQETLAGHIVLTVGGYLHRDERTRRLMDSNDNKAKVDKLHFRKIDMSDEILVLNVNNYIGDSTKREIAHAKAKKKRIRYLCEPTTENKWPSTGTSGA